jgi:peptidoglycan/LPS O-acetylase OafA/YrhL
VLARYVRRESRVLRYLADASFWIYLVHIPFLVALQSSLSTTDLAVPVRWGLTVLGTLALAIGSYALIRAGRRLALRLGDASQAPG